MKPLTFLRLFLILLFPYIPGFSQEYNFRVFGSEDGIPQPYVYSISQDSLGNLWIGTGEGLSRFDGLTFKNFTTSDSLADNFITCSLHDGKNLWFGHMNGRVSLFNGIDFRSITVVTETDRITCLSKSMDGKIWAGTLSSGIFSLDKKSMEFRNAVPAGGEAYNCILNISENELLTGTNTGLKVCRFGYRGEMLSMEDIHGIPKARVSSVKRSRSSAKIIVSTENDGIFLLSGDSKKFNTDLLPVTEELTGIQDMCEDAFSNIWIAAYGKGLVKLEWQKEKLKARSLNGADGNSGNNVRTVFEDREGNIWSGNFGNGLTRVSQSAFVVTGYDRVNYGSNVFSIEDDGQYRWVGTDLGLIMTDNRTGSILSFFGRGDGLPSDSVTALYSHNGKELWIGTGRHGVFRMKNETGRITPCKLSAGVLENSVTMISGRGDLIFVGTKKGLCIYDSRKDKITHYSITLGLPHNFINGLLADNDGRLWVTTRSRVLSYISDDKVHNFPLSLGYGMTIPGPVTSDSLGRVWVGSHGNGIFIIDPDSVLNITTKEGLLSDFCYSLTSDGGNIWVGHKGGLSRIRITDYSMKHVVNFGQGRDNLQFNQNAVTRDSFGRILFGTDRGLVCYDPSMDLPYAVSPILRITAVKVNDENIDIPKGRLILPPGKYKLRIEYIGTSLREPDLVRYQSILEGYDQSLSEISGNRYAIYPNLTDGEYVFVLKSSSGDGVVTPVPLRLNIVIKMPLWKHWWFFPSIIALLSVVVYLMIRKREQNLIKEKKLLEKKVQERTFELECSKNEIQQQRDEIREKNMNITSSIMYARQIQKAMLPPAEMLDKVLPDSFIMNKPKDIVSGDFYWLSRKNGKVIFTVADCTGHGVPGAFMSLLGITLLNEIVNVHGITNSDQIVAELRRRVIESLQQHRKKTTTRDGMDISLCVMDVEKRKLQFTGGMNDMVMIRKGKLELLRADRLDVSVSYNELGSFSRTEVDCRKGDMLYLFSDGYQDQFGGEFDKKFLRPHFYTTLKEIHTQPVLNQKELLEKKLISWMKNHIQTDDITIMGIRIH